MCAIQELVLAVVGMCGSGKSEVGRHLRAKGWAYVHFGKVTMDEVAARGLPVNEASERLVREDLRRQGGMGVYADRILPAILEELQRGPVVIDGLYSWSEYRTLKARLKDTLVVLAVVVSSRKERYRRLALRPMRPLTPEEAERRDIAEIEQLEKGGPIAMADLTVLNDGTLEDLRHRVDGLLQNLANADAPS